MRILYTAFLPLNPILIPASPEPRAKGGLENSAHHSPRSSRLTNPIQNQRRSVMSKLKDKLAQKIDEQRARTQKLNKEFGNVVIDQVTISQAIGGVRDVRCLVTDISYLDPHEGIRFRGKTI